MSRDDDNKLDKAIVKEGVSRGFKTVAGFLWRSDGDRFDTIIASTVNRRNRITYLIKQKKMSYDDLFWDIMGMHSNRNERMSLRANGAFASPSYTIEHGQIENVIPFTPESVSALVDRLESSLSFFTQTHLDLSRYITDHPDHALNNEELRSLAYLDMGDIDGARQLALANLGNEGFANEGKGFFERLLLIYGGV